MNYLDLVRVNTDTIFDEEGVPVSITPGSQARFVEKMSSGMCLISVFWKGEGSFPETLAVHDSHLQLLEAHDPNCRIGCPHG